MSRADESLVRPPPAHLTPLGRAPLHLAAPYPTLGCIHIRTITAYVSDDNTLDPPPAFASHSILELSAVAFWKSAPLDARLVHRTPRGLDNASLRNLPGQDRESGASSTRPFGTVSEELGKSRKHFGEPRVRAPSRASYRPALGSTGSASWTGSQHLSSAQCGLRVLENGICQCEGDRKPE